MEFEQGIDLLGVEGEGTPDFVSCTKLLLSLLELLSSKTLIHCFFNRLVPMIALGGGTSQEFGLNRASLFLNC